MHFTLELLIKITIEIRSRSSILDAVELALPTSCHVSNETQTEKFSRVQNEE